jgi:hypothetical protein
MGQPKHMLELAEEMDQARGLDCSLCCGRVSASDWSNSPYIRKARDEGHNAPSAGVAPRPCTATIEVDAYMARPAEDLQHLVRSWGAR